MNDTPTPVAVVDSSTLCCSGSVGKFLSPAYVPSNMTSIDLSLIILAMLVINKHEPSICTQYQKFPHSLAHDQIF